MATGEMSKPEFTTFFRTPRSKFAAMRPRVPSLIIFRMDRRHMGENARRQRGCRL